MADMLTAWVSADRGVLAGLSIPAKHERPVEPRVTQSIDSIFILGETFRFERPAGVVPDAAVWSVLDDRFRSGLGVALPKVCASADATALSVPLVLSGTTPDQRSAAVTAPSGLARLAAAGYETAWISNQEGLEFYRDEPRDFVWVAQGYARQHDEALLPIATTFLSKYHGKNKALVLHLFDSHAVYEDRYPHRDEPAGLASASLEALRYVRANEHTVSVLLRIAAMIDAVARPAFAVYVSDHGENLLIDHNGLHYHFGARTSVEAAYVPSFVFWNRAFLDAYHPNERLAELRSASSLAHVDVYRIWMNFSGLPVTLSVTADPKIHGKVKLTDTAGAVSCTRLLP
jgi:glucan phosphoethanolaminetransferase (alkaline phosphatase superfamily)